MANFGKTRQAAFLADTSSSLSQLKLRNFNRLQLDNSTFGAEFKQNTNESITKYSHNELNERRKKTEINNENSLLRNNNASKTLYHFSSNSQNVTTIEKKPSMHSIEDDKPNRYNETKNLKKHDDETESQNEATRVNNEKTVLTLDIDEFDHHSIDDDNSRPESRMVPEADPKFTALIIPDTSVANTTQNSTKPTVSDYQLELERALSGACTSTNIACLAVPKECVMKTCIRRKKGSQTMFTMYLEKNDGNYQKILAAQVIQNLPRKIINIYSLYLNNGNHASKRSEVTYIGTLKANLSNTNFKLKGLLNTNEVINYDDSDDDYDNAEPKQIYMNIRYKDRSIFSATKVEKFEIDLPIEIKIANTKSRFSQKNTSADDEFIEKYSKTEPTFPTRLISKVPVYSEMRRTYTLNFNGRVSEPSTHNFQIITPSEPNIVNLQFGKIGKNSYICDLTYPFTPFHAFAIALSNLSR